MRYHGELDTVLRYHERTKHHFNRYARGPGSLDWANQPDPFRRYRGATLVKLPRLGRDDEPLSPAYEHLYRPAAVPSAPVTVRTLSRLFEYALARRGETLNVLGATSGDTGSAAEYALRGRRGIRVFMLSPHGKMSPFQTAQMYSLQEANVFNLAVRGVFDDCQDIVKRVSADAAFKRRLQWFIEHQPEFAEFIETRTTETSIRRFLSLVSHDRARW